MYELPEIAGKLVAEQSYFGLGFGLTCSSEHDDLANIMMMVTARRIMREVAEIFKIRFQKFEVCCGGGRGTSIRQVGQRRSSKSKGSMQVAWN